jgi:hypothetical protein
MLEGRPVGRIGQRSWYHRESIRLRGNSAPPGAPEVAERWKGTQEGSRAIAGGRAFLRRPVEE